MADVPVTSWEERMSRQAVRRQLTREAIEEAEAICRLEDERRAAELAGIAVQHFEGTCDVCGEQISLDWLSTDGTLDIGVADDGRVFTWIRHPRGVIPDCGVYFSRVYGPWTAK